MSWDNVQDRAGNRLLEKHGDNTGILGVATLWDVWRARPIRASDMALVDTVIRGDPAMA